MLGMIFKEMYLIKKRFSFMSEKRETLNINSTEATDQYTIIIQFHIETQ